MLNRLFAFIEGGIVTTALFIIFGKIKENDERQHSYTPYYRPHYHWRTKKDDEIIFDTFDNADDVLMHCEEAIDKFGFCTILMLKNYVKDVTGKESPRKYSDYRLGWKSLDRVNVKKSTKGYFIDFPVPKEFYSEEGE